MSIDWNDADRQASIGRGGDTLEEEEVQVQAWPVSVSQLPAPLVLRVASVHHQLGATRGLCELPHSRTSIT